MNPDLEPWVTRLTGGRQVRSAALPRGPWAALVLVVLAGVAAVRAGLVPSCGPQPGPVHLPSLDAAEILAGDDSQMRTRVLSEISTRCQRDRYPWYKYRCWDNRICAMEIPPYAEIRPRLLSLASSSTDEVERRALSGVAGECVDAELLDLMIGGAGVESPGTRERCAVVVTDVTKPMDLSSACRAWGFLWCEAHLPEFAELCATHDPVDGRGASPTSATPP